jgi:hypothetical protein
MNTLLLVVSAALAQPGPAVPCPGRGGILTVHGQSNGGMNRVRIAGNDDIYFNGHTVDQGTLAQYLDQSATLIPRPGLTASISANASCVIVQRIRALVK